MRILPLLLLCVLALSACGGSGGPSIDKDVATTLARQADAVAVAKDPCVARDHARILQRQTIAATNAGRIPAQFQETLLARVNELVSELELRCLPVPASAQPTGNPAPPPAVTIRVRPRDWKHGHDERPKDRKGPDRKGHGRKDHER